VKKIAFIVLLIASFTTNVSAEEKMRPLSEVLDQEQSKHMFNYVLQRCSALMMEMAQRTGRGESREGSEELIQFMTQGYETFASMSANLISDIKERPQDQRTKSVTETLDVILKLHKKYFNSMEDHYVLTGNSISDEVQGDLIICVDSFKQINK
jgi:hypothetical protein